MGALEGDGNVEKDVGIVLSDVVGNLLHHCNHRQPWNCRRYREYRIETETDDLGLPEGVGQASIHSLSGLYEKLHLLLFGAPEPFGSQASLYSLLFGTDGPPPASDEDFSAKLEILSKTIFDGCDKNQDGGLEITEFSLETLLRPPFLRSFSRIIFYLMKQGLAVASSLLDPNSSGPAQGANSTSLDFK